ncbi:type II toxin-antitoxin system RelE/ParE family toxin [uncultured Rhodospira sp.]|uniref:type II toxin-antitoxin system RelE/ParE family toxin n=1 Tax=uncultured Rhodospira sp. TaxID=1936189 RepID=UPI00260E2C4F|nr:type II toxin-antitoxin system RelE/ParE family toxin [uncultured Rhodospira sp.]
MTAPWRLDWRPMAREDLRSIVRYIGRDNPSRARTFGREVRDKVSRLANHPEMGRPGRPGLPDGIRELVAHPGYVVFYRLHTETRTVEILRIKHTAQRIP